MIKYLASTGAIFDFILWIFSFVTMLLLLVAKLCPTLYNPMDYRLLCPSLSPGVCSDSCPLSWWYYLTNLILCCLILLLFLIFPRVRVFSSELALRTNWPKYWSFNFIISPSNEYSRLISFRIDQFDLLAVQETLRKSSPAAQFESIDSLVLRRLYSPTLTSAHYYWRGRKKSLIDYHY